MLFYFAFNVPKENKLLYKGIVATNLDKAIEKLSEYYPNAMIQGIDWLEE